MHLPHLHFLNTSDEKSPKNRFSPSDEGDSMLRRGPITPSPALAPPLTWIKLTHVDFCSVNAYLPGLGPGKLNPSTHLK